MAFADFDRNRTDNSIVVTELLSELSFTGFAEQILVFDACRNIPFEGRLRAGRISRPFDRVPGVTAAVLRARHDRAESHVRRRPSAEEASFSACLMRALAGRRHRQGLERGRQRIRRAVGPDVRVCDALRCAARVGEDRLPRQLGERDVGDPVLARFPADHFPAVNVEMRVHPDDRHGRRRRRARSAGCAPGGLDRAWTGDGGARSARLHRGRPRPRASSRSGDVGRSRRTPTSTLDITFVPPHHSRGADDSTAGAWTDDVPST